MSLDQASSDGFGPSVVVVGGGIAGLFCARELARSGFSVTLVEYKEVLGGRIETLDLRGFIGSTQAKTTRFKAECGPMRFERSIQPMFFGLCRELGVQFRDFPSTSALPPPADVLLDPGERCRGKKTPLSTLELLKLGVYRMFGQPTEVSAENRVELNDPAWLQRLSDDTGGFDELRRTARFRGQFLRDLGLSNVLHDVLSHRAVDLIEQEGTFYHLIPDNPNAVEWGIFWLRAFKDPTLETIPAGVRTVTERLQAQLQTECAGRVRLRLRCEAVRIAPADGSDGVTVEVLDLRTDEPSTLTADHVVLALPRAPLIGLAGAFPEQIRRDLQAVIGFPLLKAFLCLRRPSWWYPGKPDPQEFAWDLRTREVHYFLDEEKENAMVMVYTDRPKSRHWGAYILDPWTHDRAQLESESPLKVELLKRFFEEQRRIAATNIEPRTPVGSHPLEFGDPALHLLLDLLKRVPELADVVDPAASQLAGEGTSILLQPDAFGRDMWESVTDYAIRDWSHDPFGAGCHAWSPRAKSWEVRGRLKAFGLIGREDRANIHVCGEAYSDYQGFIEGALRSARDAIATII